MSPMNTETMRAVRHGVTLIDTADGLGIGGFFGPESHTRDVIAAFAHAAGYDVAIEVPAGGAGRIDVLVRGRSADMVIEVKKKLMTPSQVRKGMQQVDGYARHRVLERPNVPVLTSWDIDEAQASRLNRLYPDVVVETPPAVCNRLILWAKRDQFGGAVERLNVLQREVLVRTKIANLLQRVPA